LTVFTIKIKRMVSVSKCSHPEVSSGSGFAGITATFGVGFGGIALVSMAWIDATLARVLDGDVLAMRPAVI
jgi:hypothetical protein